MGPFEAKVTDVQALHRGCGVGGNLCGKRMRGIDQYTDLFLHQIIAQTMSAAEAAGAYRA